MDRCFNARHRSSNPVSAPDPSVHELASSDAKLLLGVGGAGVNFAGAENCPLLTARNILCSSKLSERNAPAKFAQCDRGDQTGRDVNNRLPKPGVEATDYNTKQEAIADCAGPLLSILRHPKCRKKPCRARYLTGLYVTDV
ncbi:hypothetical protein Bbelb_059230 [Branchiostoma belcheri]|nr:hypothetical protein Bbelb_059230 [Branchiostoma belcheri]